MDGFTSIRKTELKTSSAYECKPYRHFICYLTRGID